MVRLSVRNLSSLFSVAAMGIVASLTPKEAHAQLFALNPGTALGSYQFASYNTAAGGAASLFAGNGQMVQAGGGYPSLAAVNTNVSTVNGIALPTGVVNQAAQGNYGGGTASLFAVQGNSCGVFTNAFGVTDANPFVGNTGVASLTAMYGQGSWTYNGVAPAVFVGGAFLTMTAAVSGAPGSYVEAGVDALFTDTRGGVNVFNQQAFISFGFQGTAGGNFINANRYVYLTGNGGNSVTFGAASYVAFNLQPGDVLSIQGTVTAFGDPASISYSSDPSLSGFDNGNDNTGVSAAPEPGSVALVLPALAPVIGVVVRRRRQSA